MNFYNNFDGHGGIHMSITSKQVQPLDLSRRGSVTTENSSGWSDRSSSPPENFDLNNDDYRSLHPSQSGSHLIGPLFAHQQRDTPSPAGSLPSYSSTDRVKDATYYERRKKNNAAAKVSRNRRKAREAEIAAMARSAEIEYNFNVAKLAAVRQELEALLKLE